MSRFHEQFLPIQTKTTAQGCPACRTCMRFSCAALSRCPAPLKTIMQNVLSIQSHVVFGHAGNSAAVFPMRRMGVNVWPLNTVQFSNHTQYGRWTGGVVDADELTRVIEGIGAIGVLSRCNAILSGYLGSPEQGAAVVEIVRM